MEDFSVNLNNSFKEEIKIEEENGMNDASNKIDNIIKEEIKADEYN